MRIFLTFLLAGAAIPSAFASAAAEERIIVLPPFEVSSSRPWLYAEIPHFQLLSLSTERESRTFLSQIARAQTITPLFLPLGYNLNFSARSTLFLKHFAGNEIVNRASTGDVHFASFGIVLSDTSILFPSDEAARDWVRGEHCLAIDFLNATALGLPRIPIWYRDGMGDLLRAAESLTAALEIPAKSWRGPELMSIVELFALKPDPHTRTYAQDRREERNRYIRGASAFAHWGFFGESGNRRSAFLKFVGDVAANGPPTEEAFRRAFGLGFADAQVAIDAYAQRGVRAVRIPWPTPALAVTRVEVRPATRGEVARIVGESYIFLGQSFQESQDKYRRNARNVLEDAYADGDRSPAILLQLGLLEHFSGNDAKAESYLETSVAAKVERSGAYITLANLRFATATAGGKRLTPEAAETILAPLRQAHRLYPRSAETYLGMLSTWRSLNQTPPFDDLQILSDGIESSPQNLTLLRRAIPIFERAGWPADAVEKWRARAE